MSIRLEPSTARRAAFRSRALVWMFLACSFPFAQVNAALAAPVPDGKSPDASEGRITVTELKFLSGSSIPLPQPDTTGGLPLLTALSRRRSTREFRADALPLQLVSDLLWAADGVNRRESGKRTAATAHNWQNLDLYLFTGDGVYRFDAGAHALIPIRGGDLRALTGLQPFAAEVPIDLVYVSDRSKVPEPRTEEEMSLVDGAHAGLVAQNIYLFAASAGLGTVLRASLDRPALAAALGLTERQRIVLAQSVGYPQATP